MAEAAAAAGAVVVAVAAVVAAVAGAFPVLPAVVAAVGIPVLLVVDPVLQAAVGIPALRAVVHPVLRVEVVRPVLRAEVVRPVLRAEVACPVLRAEATFRGLHNGLRAVRVLAVGVFRREVRKNRPVAVIVQEPVVERHSFLPRIARVLGPAIAPPNFHRSPESVLAEVQGSGQIAPGRVLAQEHDPVPGQARALDPAPEPVREHAQATCLRSVRAAPI